MQNIYISRHPLEDMNPEIAPEVDDYPMAEGEVELPVDIARQGDYLVVTAPMVGAKNEDISITVNNDILFIHKAATPLDDKKVDNYYLQECHWGSIAREVQLPMAVDPSQAKASLQDGLLKIILPIIAHRKTRIIKVR